MGENRRGKASPLIKGFYMASVRSGEVAESILREEGERPTPKQRAYLMHVVEEGRRCREMLGEIRKEETGSGASQP